MRKVTDFIVEKRKYVLSVFIIFALISVFLMKKVNINYDITKYLPNTSETRIGMNIMEKSFKQEEESTLNIMFSNLKDYEKLDIKNTLSKIKDVYSISYEKDSEKYNKDNYTLYEIKVAKKEDSKEAKAVYDKVKEEFSDYDFALSGTIADRNEPVLSISIVGLAVLCALIILIVMSTSFVEPFLFMFVILLAVLLNMGTNVIFNSVSNITNSIAAILQMALSMDYSIMLMNRYNQEKEKEEDKIKAMKKALIASFRSISSSSITTIVGLLALVFMSFTIGKDLGFVLAKGVLLSLLCIFTCLPGLILIFQNLIDKTKKRSLSIKLNVLGKFSFKIRYISVFIFIIVFAGSFLLKGNLGIEYTDKSENKVNSVFRENNQMALIYDSKYENMVADYCRSLKDKNKVDEVLCYGNTIGEKLTYNNLNNKLKEMEVDTNLDDSLLKIIYYNYYNKFADKMTFNEFVTFIENKVLNNSTMNKNMDSSIKENIEKLDKFTKIDEINKKRTMGELASIFGIDNEQVKDLFTYYLSKNNNEALRVDDFIHFINHDVLTNPKYASSIGAKEKASLKRVNRFTSKNEITKYLTKNEMASMFGLDTETVEQLYIYYYSLNGSNIELSINEFTSFILEDVITDKNYESLFDENTIKSLSLLNTLSNKEKVTTRANKTVLAKIFNLDEESIDKILLLNYLDQENSNKMSLREFVLAVDNIKSNTSYLDDTDVDLLLKLKIFAKNENEVNTTKVSKIVLANMFDSNLVEFVYSSLGLSSEKELSPIEFVGYTLSHCTDLLDDATLNNFKLIYVVMGDSINDNRDKYNKDELAYMLNIDKKSVNKIFNLTDYISGNVNFTMTPYDFVNYLLDNSTNEFISASMNQETKNALVLARSVMDSTINNKTYSTKGLADLIEIDESSVKSIYALYNKDNEQMSPQTFTNFILDHKNDKMLQGKLDTSTVDDLTRLKNVMNSILNNITYTSSDISILLGIDKESVDLLYGLYTLTYINKDMTLSVDEFTFLLVDDVLTNDKYKSNFDLKMMNELKTVRGVINATINDTKYTASEIYGILSNISNDLKEDLVELVYIYYGAENRYNNTWTLTIEEFINYLNDDILKDKRFNDFIENDMRKTIKDSKETLASAKELLVGKDYSRMVLNTSFDLEGKDTYKFIKKIKDELIKDNDGIYIIGDSPMSYEMNKTFNSELDLITIITMVAIFIVVALSFKSIIIPLILVLIIQTAVYLTMGILSFIGGEVYFIALLIVQSILMGATIDYAIVYTSYYLESRAKLDVKNSIINAYNKSIHTIATSALILIIVTLIIGNFTSAVAAKICKTLSEGTMCASLLILLLLPALLGGLDRFINKKKAVE